MSFNSDVNIFFVAFITLAMIMPIFSLGVFCNKKAFIIVPIYYVIFISYLYNVPTYRHEKELAVYNIEISETDSTLVVANAKNNISFDVKTIKEYNLIKSNDWYLVKTLNTDPLTRFFNSYVSINYNLVSKEDYIKSHKDLN